MAQLPYNLSVRSYVESSEAVEALDASGAAVVASFVLHGGLLTGKYADGSRVRSDEPTNSTTPSCDRFCAAQALRRARRPARYDACRARDRVCLGDRVATVLFGATTAEQVAENARAAELLDQLTPVDLAELQAIGVADPSETGPHRGFRCGQPRRRMGGSAARAG